MLKKICIFLVVFFLIITLPSCGGGYIIPNNLPDISNNKQSNSPSSISGSSHAQSFLPAETISANITREIVSPKRDEGFFNESKEVIVVLIKVTSLKKDGLKNLEIWEIPGDGLKIENCSYPLKTSSIKDLLSYGGSDKSYIQAKDIYNITYIKEKLTDNSSLNPYKYIYLLLNNSTKCCLLNASVKNGELRAQIQDEFNKIINNPTEGDFNVSCFANCEVIPRNSVQLMGVNKGTYIGFNNNSDSFLRMNDYRLFKRRLLEDAFPDGIKRVPYYKDHEDLELDNNEYIMIGKNDIGDSDLRYGESIIFKYYLRPEKIGVAEIRSLIRADGFYFEDRNPINIIEREPRFEVGYISPTKELVVNEPMEFVYYIKYLGGDDNEKSFDISINPVTNKATREDYCRVDPQKINKTLSRGKTESFAVNVTYLQEGYRLSPPTITIEGKEEKFEADIYVYKEDDQPARLHFESLALGYQKDANDLTWWMVVFTILSTFILFVEIFYLSPLHENANKTILEYIGKLKNIMSQKIFKNS